MCSGATDTALAPPAAAPAPSYLPLIRGELAITECTGLAQISPVIRAIIGQAIGIQRGSGWRMAGSGEATSDARSLHPRRWPVRWEGEITQAPPALPALDATLH